MRKVNIVWSPTALDLFRLCEQRYDYRYNWNKILMPHHDNTKRRDEGTLVHLGNEAYYTALKNGFKYDVAVGAALAKIKSSGAEGNLDPKEISQVVNVMEEYYDFWRVEDQNIQVVGVEMPFLMLIHEDDEMRVYVDGKIDLVVNTEKYTNLPWDHKSMQRDNEVFRMSNQFKCYALACKSNFITVNKIGFQSTLQAHEKFKRPMLTYDPLIFEQWIHNVVVVSRHYLNCVAEGEWPMNETSCDKFNRRCEYYEVCDSSGKDAKVFKLNVNYKDGDRKGRVLTLLGESSEVPKTEDKQETKSESQTVITNISGNS